MFAFACKDKQDESAAAAAGSPAAAEAGEAKEEAAEAGTAEAGAGTDTGSETETGTDTGDAVPLEPLPERFEPLGLAICDQYVSDYETCIAEQVPEAEREAQRRVIAANLSSWRQTLAGGEAGRRGLQTACRIAREQAKRDTQAWGCTW